MCGATVGMGGVWHQPPSETQSLSGHIIIFQLLAHCASIASNFSTPAELAIFVFTFYSVLVCITYNAATKAYLSPRLVGGRSLVIDTAERYGSLSTRF